VVGKKESDEVHVCGDFRVTYNACASVETYAMPQIEDMHSALRGCTVFSVLDIKQAYHQVPIAKESQPYLTINTHIGVFVFKRLPNGIHSGPAIFQRIMDSLLSDIPKAVWMISWLLAQMRRTTFTHSPKFWSDFSVPVSGSTRTSANFFNHQWFTLVTR